MWDYSSSSISLSIIESFEESYDYDSESDDFYIYAFVAGLLVFLMGAIIVLTLSGYFYFLALKNYLSSFSKSAPNVGDGLNWKIEDVSNLFSSSLVIGGALLKALSLQVNLYFIRIASHNFWYSYSSKL